MPEKNPYRRFDQDFVEQRRLALEKCVQKIVNHPVLQKDPDLKMFLESDSFALDVSNSLPLFMYDVNFCLILGQASKSGAWSGEGVYGFSWPITRRAEVL